jgi:hypothetical protein
MTSPTNPASPRPIYTIAEEILRTWPKVNYAAAPYLQAMLSLTKISDSYGMDSGVSVVLYFLSNASSWRGEDARRIKKELNQILKTERG